METSETENWWYLSFADDDGFRGAAVVGPEQDLICAVMLAGARGCNPNGEVLGVIIPADLVPPERFRFRVLSKAEVDEMDSLYSGEQAP